MILTLVHSTRLLPQVVKIMSVPRSVSRAIPRPPLAIHEKSAEIGWKARGLPELRLTRSVFKGLSLDRHVAKRWPALRRCEASPLKRATKTQPLKWFGKQGEGRVVSAAKRRNRGSADARRNVVQDEEACW